MYSGEGSEEGLREDGQSEGGGISKRIDCRLMKCTTVLHGGAYVIKHRRPHKSVNKMRKATGNNRLTGY